jgi:LmbE family N-acetylglucosaminyl deacetylase
VSARDLLARLSLGESHMPVLVVVAHPDDETIGLGALLCRLPDATVLHVTDGAPRNGLDAARHGFASVAAYAGARRTEALAALAIAGIPEERALTLGVPDQEATLHMVPVARRIAEAVRTCKPELVVTQAYEGGHPDHDAVAFATHTALAIGPPRPLVEMTGYHAGPEHIQVGRFLPPDTDIVAFALSAESARAKRRMVDCYVTQRDVLAQFPLTTELLRPAPPADFTRAPHSGILFYERFDWGMDGARFRVLAAAARDGLGLQ